MKCEPKGDKKRPRNKILDLEFGISDRKAVRYFLFLKSSFTD